MHRPNFSRIGDLVDEMSSGGSLDRFIRCLLHSNRRGRIYGLVETISFRCCDIIRMIRDILDSFK